MNFKEGKSTGKEKLEKETDQSQEKSTGESKQLADLPSNGDGKDLEQIGEGASSEKDGGRLEEVAQSKSHAKEDLTKSNGEQSNAEEGQPGLKDSEAKTDRVNGSVGGQQATQKASQGNAGKVQESAIQKAKRKIEPLKLKLPKISKIMLIKIALAVLAVFLLCYFLFKNSPDKNSNDKNKGRKQGKKDLALIKDLQNRLNMLGQSGAFNPSEVVQAYNFLLIYLSQFGIGKNIDWTTDEYLRFLFQRLPEPVFAVFREITFVFNLVFYGGKLIQTDQSQSYFNNVRALANLNLSGVENNDRPS